MRDALDLSIAVSAAFFLGVACAAIPLLGVIAFILWERAA